MLTSLQNPLVKQIRKLHKAKERREQQLSLLEGTHLLQEAIAVGYPLVTVCSTVEWQSHHPELWEQVSQQAQRLELVSPEVLSAIATTVTPDGVIATIQRSQSTEEMGSVKTLGLALETIQDPGNLGTIIRTAAAAGADRLWLSSDSVEPDNPKVMRASAGQWFRLPISVTSDLKSVVLQCQQQGIQVIATTPRAPLTYWDLDLQPPSLILLGNEGAGLSDELTRLATIEVSIPLAAGVESLNVATTAALILYEAQRQRRLSA